MRRLFAALGRTVVGALCGMSVAFCGLILAVEVCDSEPGQPVGLRDTYLGLIVCVTFGPAVGIAVAHLCFGRPSAPGNPPAAPRS